MKFVFIVHPGSATSNAAALTAFERIPHRHRELYGCQKADSPSLRD